MTRVLEVLDAENTRLNPFIAQLINSLEAEGADIQYWSVLSALRGHFDTVHVHWPERLYRSQSLMRCLIKTAILACIILLWKMRGIPIIWTVHNLAPHEGLNRIERFADLMFRRSVTLAVYLNHYDDSVPGIKKRTKRAVIKHGDYVEWMAEYPHEKPRANHFCLFGNLRPYKGIESLIAATKLLPQHYSLLISGKPYNSSYEDKLRAIINSDTRIQLDAKFHIDADLVAAITSSSLTVLPYQSFYNSGAVFLSLSLNRPVLVPENPYTLLLQSEFGSNWVALYSKELTANDIQKTLLDNSGSRARSYPDFTDRHWSILGRQYMAEISSLLDHS